MWDIWLFRASIIWLFLLTAGMIFLIFAWAALLNANRARAIEVSGVLRRQAHIDRPLQIGVCPPSRERIQFVLQCRNDVTKLSRQIGIVKSRFAAGYPLVLRSWVNRLAVVATTPSSYGARIKLSKEVGQTLCRVFCPTDWNGSEHEPVCPCNPDSQLEFGRQSGSCQPAWRRMLPCFRAWISNRWQENCDLLDLCHRNRISTSLALRTEWATHPIVHNGKHLANRLRRPNDRNRPACA